jgi:hypothetical protein
MTKSNEKVSVPFTADHDVAETIALNRRMFIWGIGFAVLKVQCLPLTAHASGKTPNESSEAADSLVIHSSSGFVPHVHDLLIPYAVLNAPPLQGVELKTTEALCHAHRMVLTQKELITVNQRGTVTQKASSHVFVIALPKRQDHI